MTHHSLLSLWWFSYRVFFSNCVDCWKHTTTKLVLTKPPWHRFPPWLCSKSSGLKCTEHITERRYGSHLALFCFTKSTHFFLLLLASGRSSSKNGITCCDIPLASSFWLLQPAATQIVGISSRNNEWMIADDSAFTEISRNRFWNWHH